MTATTVNPLRQRTLRALTTGCAAAVVVLSLASAASGHPTAPPPEPEGGISQGDLDASIHVWDPSENIIELGQNDEEENVVVLESDLLFAAMEWQLPDHAGPRIAELVEQIPDGASVEVHGHTDSNPVPESYDFGNQELSERRADAVADVLGQERPDLALSVEGFGDTAPTVTEDPEDPTTYAANRRVEIRYGN